MIFSFMARLGLDVTQFEAGVKRAQSAAAGLSGKLSSSLGSGMKALGAAAAAAFTVSAVKGFAESVAETAGEIKDMSELLEVSTDEVQRLQIAADEANISFSKVVGSFQKIEQMKASALSGDEKAQGIFKVLGIDPNDRSINILKSAVDASQRGVKENAAAFDLLGGKVVGLKRVVSELNSLPKIDLISERSIQQIDRAEKVAKGMWRRAWSSVVEGTGNALANIETAKGAYDAYAYAMPAAEKAGLSGEAARKFRLDALNQVIEGVQAKQLGLSVPELRAQNAPKQDTLEQAVLRSAIANEATLQLLRDQTGK